MELSDTLRKRIVQYLRSHEFFWNGGEIAEFRALHGVHFGAFGLSPQCWKDAIHRIAGKFEISKEEMI